jgi:hypothetical protein
MKRGEIIGVIIHSVVTGFLLLAAIEGAASQDAALWVGLTYVGATIGADMYPNLTTRVNIMIGSIVASFAWNYLFYHAFGK